MSFIAKLADKVTKPIGHLGTDTLKVKVVLSITAITMACSKTVCVKPQLQRGDQKAIDLKLVQIQ